MAEMIMEGLLCPNSACSGEMKLKLSEGIYRCSDPACDVAIGSEQDWQRLYGHFTEVNFSLAKQALFCRLHDLLKK